MRKRCTSAMIMEPFLPPAVHRFDPHHRHHHMCPAAKRAVKEKLAERLVPAASWVARSWPHGRRAPGPGLETSTGTVDDQWKFQRNRMAEVNTRILCLFLFKKHRVPQPAEDLVLVGARHTHIMAARHRERLSERCHDVIGTSALPRFPRAYAGGSANALALVMHALCICPERNHDYSRACSPVTQTPRSKYGCPLASPLALTLQMQSPAPPAPYSGHRAETLDDVMVRARSLRGGLRTECIVECALVRTSCL